MFDEWDFGDTEVDVETPEAPTDYSPPDVEVPAPADAAPPTAGEGTPDAGSAPNDSGVDANGVININQGGNDAPIVQAQQDVAMLNDNSDLGGDVPKGGPVAAGSTRDSTVPESRANKFLGADEPQAGQNMSLRQPADKFDPLAGPKETGPASPGIIGGAIDWAKANPQLAAALLTTGAGALGGMGKASLDKEAAERKAASDMALLERKSALDLQNKEASAQFARDFGAAGTLAGGGVNMRPNAGIINGGLRRPGGAPVFNGRKLA